MASADWTDTSDAFPSVHLRSPVSAAPLAAGPQELDGAGPTRLNDLTRQRSSSQRNKEQNLNSEGGNLPVIISRGPRRVCVCVCVPPHVWLILLQSEWRLRSGREDAG